MQNPPINANRAKLDRESEDVHGFETSNPAISARKTGIGEKPLPKCCCFLMIFVQQLHSNIVQKVTNHNAIKYLHAASYTNSNMNKARYTAIEVACGWAGAVTKRLTKHFGRSSNARNACKRQKKQSVTDGRTDRRTDRPTDRASGL